MSSELATNMRNTAEAFVTAFSGDWHPEATKDLRSSDCTHEVLPSHLGVPKANKQQWFDNFQYIAPNVKQADMVVNDYLGSPSDRRAVVRSTMNATTPVGPYHCEYVWFFSFDENGKQITRITEFMDSKSASEIFRKFGEAGLVQQQ